VAQKSNNGTQHKNNVEKTADRTRQEQNNGKIIQLLSGPQWTRQISISYQNMPCLFSKIFLETIFFSFLYLITIQKSNQRKVNSDQ